MNIIKSLESRDEWIKLLLSPTSIYVEEQKIKLNIWGFQEKSLKLQRIEPGFSESFYIHNSPYENIFDLIEGLDWSLCSLISFLSALPFNEGCFNHASLSFSKALESDDIYVHLNTEKGRFHLCRNSTHANHLSN